AVSTASFTIYDHTEPEITNNAQNLILDCDPSNDQVIQQWLNNHGGAEAYDLCGAVHWTHDYSALSFSCGSAGHAVVRFMATDDCGNSSITPAMLSINDHLAPVINQSAQDDTIVCGSFNPEGLIQSWIDMHGGAEATDFCGTITWTNDYAGLSDTCGVTGRATVIFTASDECGNGSTTIAIISLIDQIPPVIDVEAKDTTIACGLPDQQIIIQSWVDHHGGAVAHDECGDVIWLVDFPSIEENCDTTVSYGVTFTVVDECGNRNFTTANFTITGGTTSNTLLPDDLEFNLYPNPVQDLLKLELGTIFSMPYHLSLFDACGKLLWSGQDSKDIMSIPMSQYASGIYLLHIRMKNMTYTRAVIKQ
ncbi:MAG: T9SS type A sorting domain-containing protein, partial [Saprospiraceae bacterium]